MKNMVYLFVAVIGMRDDIKGGSMICESQSN